MHRHSPIQNPSFGRTLVVAAAVLGAVAVAELGGVAVAFVKRIGHPEWEISGNGPDGPPLTIDVKRLVADSPPPVVPELGADPLASIGEDRPAGSRPVPVNPELVLAPPPLKHRIPPPAAEVPEAKGIGAPPRPTPVPLSIFTPKVDPRYSELVEQGKLLRNSGDTAGALVKLRTAEVLDPANPLAIAEQAFTFEKMGLPEKAAEQWRKILAMGDRAGLYFSMAQSKLHSAVQTTMREAGGAGEIPAGKMLGLARPTVKEDQDPAFAKKLTLNVPIRARMTEPISVREMKVFVLFYDRVNGKEIVRTNANVSNRWTSPPVDWQDGDTETLEVSYELPLPPARGERRDFHGYIVRLYYRGELQDTQAEPAALNQKFPAPYTLAE